MLRWDRLEDDVMYVLDLIQHENGVRSTRLRRAADREHENTVLVSEPHLGRDLKQWVNELTLTKYVSLEGGGKFVEEAHGGWLTQEEFEYWRLSEDARMHLPESDPPWVNGKPPLLPPK